MYSANTYLIPILNVTVRSKVNFNMNAIQEPPEPIWEDLEYLLSVTDVEAYL